MAVHLILGGARSGKSRYAEQRASATELPVTYIATAQVYDDEFAERVAHHKAQRPRHWQVVESPFHLADTLQAHDKAGHCIIVDCLTLWLAQCICDDCDMPKDTNWEAEREKLLPSLRQLKSEIILVSNEVGMGIVPLGEINRKFQDEQGRLNQAIANIADQVTFVAAGLPLTLKGKS